MTRRTVISLVVFLATQGASAGQDHPENAIVRRVAEAIQKAEPEWRFSTGICNCPPLMQEQLGVAAGSWQRSTDGPMHVSALLYNIETVEAAAKWINEQPHRSQLKGWTVTTYDLGDGANIGVYEDTSRPYTQYSLYVRKGRFLAVISGVSKDNVERVARFFLNEMSS
jgi:hypothetical protein